MGGVETGLGHLNEGTGLGHLKEGETGGFLSILDKSVNHMQMTPKAQVNMGGMGTSLTWQK